jgi:hypothetical protein
MMRVLLFKTLYKMYKIPNAHVLIVEFLNEKEIRVTSPRYEQSIIISFNTDHGTNTREIAEHWLLENGYDIKFHAEGKDCYYIICTTFQPLKENGKPTVQNFTAEHKMFFEQPRVGSEIANYFKNDEYFANQFQNAQINAGNLKLHIVNEVMYIVNADYKAPE